MKVSDEVVFLEGAFDRLNDRFFESALSRPAITIQSTPGAHGHFTPYDAWDDSGIKLKEINLGAESLDRPVPNIIATLMHEMVHYWCHIQGIKDTSRGHTYHNKRFKDEAEKRGLLITYAPRVGYSITQPSPDLISFVLSMEWENELRLYRSPKKTIAPDSESGDGIRANNAIQKKSSTRKYICPKCGLSIRATKVVRVACVDCGNVLMQENGNECMLTAG